MKDKKISNWFKVKRCSLEFSKIVWREYPRYYIAYIVYIIVNSLTPFINILLPKYIIDELTGEQQVNKLVLYIALVIGLNYLANIFQHSVNASKNKYRDNLEKYISRKISEKAMKMDFQYTEDKAVLDQMEKAKQGMSWYSGGVSGILDEISNMVMYFIQLCGVSFLVISRVPWVLVVYVVSITIETFITKVINQLELKSFVRLAKSNRIFSYIFWELQDLRFGKDIRLYGAEDMMENKADYYNKKMVDTWEKQAKESRPYQMVGGILAGIRSTLVIFLIGLKQLAGKLTLGEFVALFNAGNTLHDSIRNIVAGIQSLVKKTSYAYEYILYMEYPDALFHGKESVDSSKPHTIEFKHVSFQYPHSENTVLKDINIVLHQGDHISVVGLNGAGKTTFIKLLCRLYDPTEGVILLDGIDIRQYEYEEYVKLISVVFQDFQIYAFTAIENIMLSDSESIICTQEQMEALTKSFKKSQRMKFKEQIESVTAASLENLSFSTKEADNLQEDVKEPEKMQRVAKIIRQSGLDETIHELKHGLNTFIMKRYEDDGTELSGGQKQKMAIARALYKNAPIVILDEPTAALDPIAEYEIYRQFNTLVENKTAIYISHRLSSCQFCDIIYVFDHGEIKEVGTHEELVKKSGGIYSEMFLTQAQYYNEKPTIAVE